MNIEFGTNSPTAVLGADGWWEDATGFRWKYMKGAELEQMKLSLQQEAAARAPKPAPPAPVPITQLPRAPSTGSSNALVRDAENRALRESRRVDPKTSAWQLAQRAGEAAARMSNSSPGLVSGAIQEATNRALAGPKVDPTRSFVEFVIETREANAKWKKSLPPRGNPPVGPHAFEERQREAIRAGADGKIVAALGFSEPSSLLVMEAEKRLMDSVLKG